MSSSFSCILSCTVQGREWERGNEEEGGASDFSGRQNAKARGEGGSRVFISLAQAQQHSWLWIFIAISLCAFSFRRLVGSLVYSPPQARDTSTSISALTENECLELRQEKWGYTTTLCPYTCLWKDYSVVIQKLPQGITNHETTWCKEEIFCYAIEKR